MKMRLITTTVFAIMLFAVGASAQRVVGIDSNSTEHTLSSSRAGSVPMLDALVGKPVKVVIDFAETRKSTPKLLDAAVKGKVFKILPCGPVEALATAGDTGKMQVYLEIKLEDTLISSYSISGHAGACRLVSLRLANGSEYRAKLRLGGAQQ